MGDFEDKLRTAFDAEDMRTPVPPNLRYRVIANAVATPRRQGIASWLTVPRLATAGAVAAVLIAAGIGLRTVTQTHPITAQHSPTPAALLAFGKLPAPSLHPPQGLGGGGGGPQTVIPYFGAATMTWTGQLPKVPSSAPVERFIVPTTTDADALAHRLGATLVTAGGPKEPRTYNMPGGYQLAITMDDPVAGEPTFVINYQGSEINGGGSQTESSARTAASDALAHLGLTPSWPSAVIVSALTPLGNSPPLYIVQYQHVVQLSGSNTAGEVDGNGDPAGIQVVIDSTGKAIHLAGSVRLANSTATQSARYPTKPPASVVNAALSAPPQGPAVSPVPNVALTKATLVYTVVTQNGTGYLVPAYLFTGTFSSNGQPMEKRVLVPALESRALA